MSLPLSGQLGSAQLGAAELGALQTVTTGAGFFPFFPDVGPVKTAEAPKKKKAKKPKVKKPKKPKRVKIKASITLPTPVPVGVTETALPKPAPGFILPHLILGESVDTAAQRLRETITEEDELLLMIWN